MHVVIFPGRMCKGARWIEACLAGTPQYHICEGFSSHVMGLCTPCMQADGLCVIVDCMTDACPQTSHFDCLDACMMPSRDRLTGFRCLQATVQRVELDLRWDSKEFLAALDPTTQQLKALPATVEVWALSLQHCSAQCTVVLASVAARSPLRQMTGTPRPFPLHLWQLCASTLLCASG